MKGFTLLELLISVSAIALISVVLGQTFSTTLRTNTKTEILKEVKQNGDLVQETMVRMIQNAQSLSSGCDTTGVTSQSITIVNTDGNSTTLVCMDDTSIMRIASVSGSGIVEYLTSDSVTLGGATCGASSLLFVCKGGVGIPSSVTISFILSQPGTPVDQFETSSAIFQTSVTTRNVIR